MDPVTVHNLQITASAPDPALLDLPWDIPLEEWPAETLAALPRGISRHIVRFVRLSGRVIAIKEIGETVAYREYELLRQLRRLEVPSVVPVGVITGRQDANGERLEAVLITEHLQFSLPYRALFSQSLRPDTATRLIDALAVLLVRLHLVGFYWGDVSLSNTLFRRDAETFAAFLVDAETGDLHRELSPGQRSYDVDLARTNIIGELMDLTAGELLDEDVDEVAIGDALVARYEELWAALTTSESFDANERWRVAARIEHLNNLGFDVDELAITTDIDGTTVQIQPKVVDAGHHSRRLLRLTGLDVQENQARRLLNDLDAFRAAAERQNDDEEFVAHDWLSGVFEPTIQAVPRNLRRKLEPAQLFHEILDHRWFISERARRDVPMAEATQSYVENVLRHRPDEKAILGLAPGEKDPEYYG
ncbi:lipopolysaccharide kinase [Cellulosimicrobium cellulans]|uniref:Lipopolysaccharide kinase n=1 Tax=Cellulosimicrobium cellulans TaxID=1710 RepID=A0A1Y0HS34_CELCE|nr:lipopolysaccharide kinase [Cellulosimicrobium cellulans]